MQEKSGIDLLIFVQKIAQAIADAGGRAYFVGGFVRDQVRHERKILPEKVNEQDLFILEDLDIEVHSLSVEKLEKVLVAFGSLQFIGKSFGVYTLKDYPVDIALPRKEVRVGNRHQDFDIEVNIDMGLYDASMRRDFTANACMQDVLTGEIFDPHGGLRDIAEGVLRHVSDRHFPEDALRVLRAAQFAARFSWQVCAETISVCRQIDLQRLSKERVEGELNKALLKAERPSLFFQTLRKMGQLQIWFKELAALIDVPQHFEHHAEGDVWTHTMMVLDQAAKLRERADHPLVLMLAALIHDFGQAICTKCENGKIRSIGHEKYSVQLGTAFLQRIYGPQSRNKAILNLVFNHMRPHLLAKDRSSFQATNQLFDQTFSPHDLLLLAMADERGRIKQTALKDATLPVWQRAVLYGEDIDAFYKEEYLMQRKAAEDFLISRKKEYERLMSQPQIQGKDLLALGVEPNPNWKTVLDYAHKLHLQGIRKKKALQHVLQFAKAKNFITAEEWRKARDCLEETLVQGEG